MTKETPEENKPNKKNQKKPEGLIIFESLLIDCIDYIDSNEELRTFNESYRKILFNWNRSRRTWIDKKR